MEIQTIKFQLTRKYQQEAEEEEKKMQKRKVEPVRDYEGGN